MPINIFAIDLCDHLFRSLEHKSVDIDEGDRCERAIHNEQHEFRLDFLVIDEFQ